MQSRDWIYLSSYSATAKDRNASYQDTWSVPQSILNNILMIKCKASINDMRISQFILVKGSYEMDPSTIEDTFIYMYTADGKTIDFYSEEVVQLSYISSTIKKKKG